MFQVRFWGVRGSIPTPGESTVEVGGNTACVEVRCGDEIIILDGGTGLRGLGEKLMAETPIRASLFFSHVHWDHIQGFPFFLPALAPGNHIEMYGGSNVTTTLAETLAGQMNFPNFPLTLEQMASSMNFHECVDGQVIKVADDVSVRALSLNHPNGCYGYRVEHREKAMCYCTDTEHYEKPDVNVLELAKDADLFIYDAQYTPEEYAGEKGGVSRVGWGHSTFEQGAELAKLAGAKRLVLFHHDPGQSDAEVRDKEARCRKLFPRTDAAREGLCYEL